MYKKTSPLYNRQRQDIQVLWKQHKIDPLPILCAGEMLEDINLLQLIGQVDNVIEKFLQTEQLVHIYLTPLQRYLGQVERVMEAMQDEDQDYFARLYLLCHLILQWHR